MANRFLEHTGVEIPIIQAPMGWIARSKLASAVSNAGALGIIETSSGEMEMVREEVAKMRDLTDKPFGMNLPIYFLRDETMVDMVAQSGVKFVSTSAGSPAKYTHVLQDAGLKVYHVVPTVEAAKKAVDAGVDGLICEGAEGGGFKNPDEVSTLVLLQGAREICDLPLIAAGGICDGRGMAAAFALGAEGIQMGTRFVSALESPVHKNYKNAIVDAPVTGTWMLNKKGTPCVRALKTEKTAGIYEAGVMAPDTMKYTLDIYFGGDMEAGVALAGQTSGLIHEIKPCAQIIQETVDGFFSVMERLAGNAANRCF